MRLKIDARPTLPTHLASTEFSSARTNTPNSLYNSSSGKTFPRDSIARASSSLVLLGKFAADLSKSPASSAGWLVYTRSTAVSRRFLRGSHVVSSVLQITHHVCTYKQVRWFSTSSRRSADNFINRITHRAPTTRERLGGKIERPDPKLQLRDKKNIYTQFYQESDILHTYPTRPKNRRKTSLRTYTWKHA